MELLWTTPCGNGNVLHIAFPTPDAMSSGGQKPFYRTKKIASYAPAAEFV